MSKTDKRAKILSASASFGHHADVYWNEAQELRAEGLIELRQTFTKVGARVSRWFLV